MNRFKRVFYIICVLFFLIGIFIFLFQEKILHNTNSILYMGFIGLIKFFIKFGTIGAGLFFIELIIENIHIILLKREIDSLKNEKLELKAKLYDKIKSESSEETDIKKSNEVNEVVIKKKHQNTK